MQRRQGQRQGRGPQCVADELEVEVVERRGERLFGLVVAGVEEGEDGIWRIVAGAEHFAEDVEEEQELEQEVVQASYPQSLEPEQRPKERPPRWRWKLRWCWSGEGGHDPVGVGR